MANDRGNQLEKHWLNSDDRRWRYDWCAGSKCYQVADGRLFQLAVANSVRTILQHEAEVEPHGAWQKDGVQAE